jgi:hypothetical protein
MKCLTGFARQLLAAPILLVLASPTLFGQVLAPPSDRDIWQIGRHELKSLNTFQPSPKGFLMEVYAQYLGAKGEVLKDSWNVARISWHPNGLTVTDLALPPARTPLPTSNTGAQKAGFFHLHKPKALPLAESPLRLEGVAPMIFPDSGGIGADRYSFQYLGVETLSNLRTWTFLLKPKESAGPGAFSGKIWVADHDIVRFSGTFGDPPPRSKGTYISFDSVRFKTPSGRWLPWRTYLDQTGLPPSAPGLALRARATVWGFDSQAEDLTGTAGVQPDESVDSTHVKGAQPSSEDVYLDAEGNLIRWLGGVGLMAPPGRFEREVCDPIIQDIVTANQIVLDRQLSCRILLTAPVETVLFEGVIGISKSVFDLAPNSATVAVLIAREVALAKIRSRHLDLAWGRPDTLMLHDERDLLNLLYFTPNQIERDQADDLALEYLKHLKQYKREDLETSAIFLYTASEACKTRPALLAPRFGDGLPGCGREAHISGMALPAPPGSEPNPAMHIGSRIRINPWSDTVNLITAQQEHAPWGVIPEPMIPEIAPDDPDLNDDGFVQPLPLTHRTPPPALAGSKRK